jgi:hypothetical protein
MLALTSAVVASPKQGEIGMDYGAWGSLVGPIVDAVVQLLALLVS